LKALDVLALPLHGVQWLEASAGTGKTWNICVLVLRALLERRLEIDRILVVTFTKAAAAELRSRIRARVHAAWQLASGEADAGDAMLDSLLAQARARSGDDRPAQALRLRAALDRFDEAAVHTIHGFAQRALAGSPLATGQGLAARLVESDADMRDELLADAWRREVLAAPLPPALLERLAGAGEGPAGWRRAFDRLLARPLAERLWPQPASGSGTPSTALADPHPQHEALRRHWPAWRPEVQALVLRETARFKQNQLGPDLLARALAAWDRLLADPWNGRAAPEDALRLVAGQLALRKGQAAPEHPFFDAARLWVDTWHAWDRSVGDQHAALLRRVLEPLPQRLRERLQAQRLQSFDSLLLDLHQALARTDGTLAQALRERYPVALIDEFQDTDSLQWSLFERLFAGAGSWLVLVGDPKQSIYAFRGAELNTYLAARATVPTSGQHQLLDNQRSVAPLLAALNALFGAQARPFLQAGLAHPPVRAGSRPRDELVELAADGAVLARAPLQLWPLPVGDDGLPQTAAAAQALAAEATAAEIERLLALTAAGRLRLGERALVAADIAVLVRSHRQAAQVAAALARRGIDAALRSRESVFASAEAEDLDHLLAALINPANTAQLMRALATSAMGVDAAAIAALADDDVALGAWQSRFAVWRSLWFREGPAALLQRWLADTGVVQRVLARADGERRLTNLRHLTELLQQAARGGLEGGGPVPVLAGTPEAQWRWLQARRHDPTLQEAHLLRLASDRGLVQVLTIHQSKGLEYPVVFLPYQWLGRSGSGKPELPMEHRSPDGRLQLDFDPASLLDPDLRQAAHREALAEDQRLNYVALTRASARCHLVIGAYRRAARERGMAGACASAPLNWLVQPHAEGPLGAAIESDEAVQAWFAPGKASGARWDATGLLAAWAALAATRPEAIAMDATVWAAPARPSTPPGAATATIQDPPTTLQLAANPALPLARSWQLTSYSALANGAETAATDPPESAPAADHDLTAAEGDPAAAMSPSPGADILDFPRGATAGSCLHRVFELCRFDDPTGWPAAVARALGDVPLPAAPGFDEPDAEAAAAGRPQHAEQLLAMLGDVLNTPLELPTARSGPAAPSPPLRLAGVPDSQRLVELEFHLPLDQLDADALNDLLVRHGLPGPRWRFTPLRGGALRGFVDAVVEHAGRYWVIDWKSNHLGRTPADYAPAALADAMAEQGYHLQAQLYLLALDRLLRLRRPGYDPAQHLGGALYLFVRGVRPHWPAGSGVHLSRPDPALLATLGRWLAPPAVRKTPGGWA
jgi:exodeoxyribonuclease V beta subunit